jgi:hypothetical protein
MDAQQLAIKVAGHPNYIQAALDGRTLLFCTACHYMVWCKPDNMSKGRLDYYHNVKDEKGNRRSGCKGMWIVTVDCPSVDILNKALAWMDATVGPPIVDPEE